MAEANDTTILKVPISSTEYYLVENRERDANHDGSKITYTINGVSHSRTFYRDTTGYYSYDVDSVDGVVTNVDEFDWAVPGNGIVIWHIDQNVIDAKIGTNKINTDKHNRGVDVEEADGIQDIGEQFTTLLGDVVIGEGTSEDFWYKSNPSQLYKNKFSKDTRPPAVTNSGANSLITMSDFSEISNKMNLKVAYGDSVITPLFSVGLPVSGNEFHLSPIQNYFSFGLLADSSLYLLNSHGIIVSALSQFSDKKITSFTINDNQYLVGIYGNHLNEFVISGADTSLVSININGIISTSPVVVYAESPQINKISSGLDPKILIGTSGGKILIFKPDSLNSIPSDSLVLGSDLSVAQIAADGSYFAAISSPVNRFLEYKGFQDNEGNSVNFQNEIPVQLAVTKSKTGYISVVLTNNNNFYVISGSKVISKWMAASSSGNISFAIGDLKRDGANYIIYNEGNTCCKPEISAAQKQIIFLSKILMIKISLGISLLQILKVMIILKLSHRLKMVEYLQSTEEQEGGLWIPYFCR